MALQGVDTVLASWILGEHMKMCFLSGRRRKTPPSPFEYWRMSHFCVDNDSANHNQETNGLFSQLEEPGQDGSHWHSLQPLLIPPHPPHPPSCSARLSEALRQTWYSDAHPSCRPALCCSACRTSRPAQALSKKFSPLKRR